MFRKADPAGAPPERAVRLAFTSRDPELYDSTLDVSGWLLTSGGGRRPLLAAMMKRDPSRAVKNPPYPPFVTGEFYFALPPQGARAVGAMVRLHRRGLSQPRKRVRIGDLPVP